MGWIPFCLCCHWFKQIGGKISTFPLDIVLSEVICLGSLPLLQWIFPTQNICFNIMLNQLGEAWAEKFSRFPEWTQCELSWRCWVLRPVEGGEAAGTPQLRKRCRESQREGEVLTELRSHCRGKLLISATEPQTTLVTLWPKTQTIPFVPPEGGESLESPEQKASLHTKDSPSVSPHPRRCVFDPLGWEDPLEEGMATQSTILAWRISWTQVPGGCKKSDTTEHTHTHVTKTKAMLKLVNSLYNWKGFK